MATATSDGKAMTKTELLDAIANQTELNKRQVSEVLEILGEVIGTQLSKKGPGVFVLPDLLKVSRIIKPAVKGGGQKPNPFRPGEMMTIKAKPARSVVKIRPLKKLKDFVS